MNHFVSMKDVTEHELMQLIKLSDEMDYNNGSTPFKEQLFAGNLFFEPSTRTKMSFLVAERKLGIEALDFHNESSSTLKGESMYDTAKTFESIGASFLVIRHSTNNTAQQLAKQINIPIINAGDGTGEHPTQCLLDLYTMYEEFKEFRGLNVAIVGDIKHSRVARSNAYALQTLGANVFLSCKKEWQDPSLDFPYMELDQAVKICDVIMLLRVQEERHKQHNRLYKTSYLSDYGLTKERANNMLDHAIIMHPAPVNRGVEIDSELVECKNSRIFKQMENGVKTRMAVIYQLCQSRGITHGNYYQKRQPIIVK
ncbi:Aspartate carbamoyltransferase [Paraliobacillus sp. PM-2]|uniref:aspartate carbamoyltransferase catalytic subunit n=1 Tax=Paraliobacillus sp. PM-2 TaxID=1462524 RepID=UPI00061BBE54|nr:aspartate carbamoyltransferase catalytic subunit [Paraliobacillus sp. PM-2]CQR47766.1 Aspartate carbamoyltransferase [Paraliobacillus sp. PM-2]